MRGLMGMYLPFKSCQYSSPLFCSEETVSISLSHFWNFPSKSNSAAPSLSKSAYLQDYLQILASHKVYTVSFQLYTIVLYTRPLWSKHQQENWPSLQSSKADGYDNHETDRWPLAWITLLHCFSKTSAENKQYSSWNSYSDPPLRTCYFKSNYLFVGGRPVFTCLSRGETNPTALIFPLPSYRSSSSSVGLHKAYHQLFYQSLHQSPWILKLLSILKSLIIESNFMWVSGIWGHF